MSAIREACDIVGGITAMANKLQIKPPSVSGWISKGKVPAYRAIQIERLTEGKITIDDLINVTETKKSA